MKAYKFLLRGRRSLIRQVVWPTPGAASWLEAAPGPLVACRNGLHACRVEDLAYWIAIELWEVELDGELIDAPDAIVARRARLVRPIEAWSASAPESFGRNCAARANAHVAACALPAGHLARQYAEQAEQLQSTEYQAAVSFAAALAFAHAGPLADATRAFRAERAVHGQLLAAAAGLL
jgi:hypothetical protein